MSALADLARKAHYAEYLRRLDARALLEHYGAQNVREQVNRDGSVELIHSCLLDRVEPHHANGDANPSAAVNVEKKTFVCYSAGIGCDLIHLAMKLEGKESFAEALTAVSGFLSGATHDNEKFASEATKLMQEESPYRINPPVYSDALLKAWDHEHPYWPSRGILPPALLSLRLGYDPSDQRVVFPHFVDHQLVGWQKRSVIGELPKYLSSSGFPKSDTLYNLDQAREFTRVCVVESPMSVARAVGLGIPNVVATFGAKVGDAQIETLARSFDFVYVWFDHDPAGLAGERRLVEGLYRRVPVAVVFPDVGRDLADCSVQEIAAKMAGSIPGAVRAGMYDSYRRYISGSKTRFYQNTPQR